MPEQTGEQDKQFGEADKPYVDPNSGAAPQPGGMVSPGASSDVRTPKMAEPPIDPIYDAEMEHSAGPQGKQPGNPDAENANEVTEPEPVEQGGTPESTPAQEMHADGSYTENAEPGETVDESDESDDDEDDKKPSRKSKGKSKS